MLFLFCSACSCEVWFLVRVLVVSSLLASVSPLWTQLKWQLVEQNELTPSVFDLSLQAIQLTDYLLHQGRLNLTLGNSCEHALATSFTSTQTAWPLYSNKIWDASYSNPGVNCSQMRNCHKILWWHHWTSAPIKVYSKRSINGRGLQIWEVLH